MPEFAWKARTMSGQDVSGSITADSRQDVLALLAQQSESGGAESAVAQPAAAAVGRVQRRAAQA